MTRALPVYAAVAVSFALVAGAARAAASSSSSGVDINLAVPGCNLNAVCEPALGENEATCALDCPPAPTVTPTATASPASSPFVPGGDRAGTGGFIIGYFDDRATTSPHIYNLRVYPRTTGATISWQTDGYYKMNLSWGASLSYEAGTIQETTYNRAHSVSIDGLTSDTVYWFRIAGENVKKEVVGVAGQSFRTKRVIRVPQNAIRFRATARVRDIELTWRNPAEATMIRINRSTDAYPLTQLDGRVVFEGLAERAIDLDVERGVPYFYTLFVQDATGAYSSGALASAMLPKPERQPVSLDGDSVSSSPTPLAQPSTVDQFCSEAGKCPVPLADASFVQDGIKVLPRPNGDTVVRADLGLLVSVPSDDIKDRASRVVVTVTDPKGVSSSYFAKTDDEKTAYSAYLGELGEGGTYSIGVTVFDASGRVIAALKTTVLATFPEPERKPAEKGIFERIFVDNFALFTALLLVIIVLAIVLLPKLNDRRKSQV